MRRLRARFLREGYDDCPPPEPPPADDERTKKLVEQLNNWKDAPAVAADEFEASATLNEPDSMSIERLVPKRKGSWWLLPKDLKVDEDE